MATQENVDNMVHEVQVAGSKLASKTPEFFKLSEVYPRQYCARCSGQIVEEWELRYLDCSIHPVTIEEATETCGYLVDRILHAREVLQAYATPAVTIVRSTDQAALGELLDKHFYAKEEGIGQLARVADDFSWLNARPDQRKLDKGVSYIRCTHESFLADRGLLEDIICRCSDRHPAELVREIEADFDPVWARYMLKMVSARCFVKLTEQGFGNIIKNTNPMDILHEDGVYTYMKAIVVLMQQNVLYQGLANFATAVVSDERYQTALSSSDDTVSLPTTAPPPELHEALQAALESFAPARTALEELISATITSGSALAWDHKDRAH